MSESVELELVLPASTYSALKQAAERKHKTENELAVEAIQAYLESLRQIDPLLGLFADEPELIDTVTENGLYARESAPLRVTRQ